MPTGSQRLAGQNQLMLRSTCFLCRAVSPHRMSRIAIIDFPNQPERFDELTSNLRSLGHDVLRYRNNSALQDDPAAWDRIEVLLCTGNFPCDREFMASSPALRAVLSAVIGVEGFDIAAATERVIVVGNARTFETVRGMAESTVLMILAALYDFNGTQDVLRRNLPRPSVRKARMLYGRTVGFIGFGRIAQEIAALIEKWGVNLQFYDVVSIAEPLPSGARKVDLETLLRTSDIVSIHAVLNRETRHMLSAERLRLMKPDSILVNTARGAIIDEAALCDLLREGRLAGVALDTFEVQPLPPESPLREFPNAVLTPHRIGHTIEAEASLAVTAYENVTRVLANKPPLYVVNPEVLPAWRQKWQCDS